MTLPPGTNTTPEATPNNFSMLDDPGNVNPPAIFEPDSDYTQGIAQLWLAASGGDLWGGAIVWISLDGDTFHPIGDLENPARQGHVVAGGGGLHVGMLVSFATMDLDVTHDDAVFGRSLCWVSDPFDGTLAPCDGELFAYGAAVAGALPFHYILSDLNRALYGSMETSLSPGQLFTRIDVAASIGTPTLTLLRFNLPPDYIGVTLYLKFQSFNRFGQSLQDLADVTEYTYIPCGRGHTGPFGEPAIPTGFDCKPLAGAGAIYLSWDANPSSDAVLHYEIWRASGLGAAFTSATLLEKTEDQVWIDAELDALSEWTYFLKACNVIGCSEPTDGSSCTATLGETGEDDDTCDMQDIYSGTAV